MDFRKWQNGRAYPREIEAAECQLCARHSDILDEGQQGIIRQGDFLEEGPSSPGVLWRWIWRREITGIPKECKAILADFTAGEDIYGRSDHVSLCADGGGIARAAERFRRPASKLSEPADVDEIGSVNPHGLGKRPPPSGLCLNTASSHFTRA